MIVGRVVCLVKLISAYFAFLVEFVGKLKLVGENDRLFIILDPFLFGSQDFDVGFCSFGVIPEVGCEGFLLVIGDLDQFLIDVKDTSSTHQGAPQYLLFVR